MFKQLIKNFLDTFKKYAPIAEYGNLTISDPRYALRNLQTYYSEVYAMMVWESACKDVGVSEDKCTPLELLKVYKHMSKQSDLVGIVGQSLYVKLLTYIKLSEKTSKQPAIA